MDLFSGDRSRTCHALQCLLREPQNNLGFFVDGIAAGQDEVHRLVASITGLSGTEASVFLAELIATILVDSGDYYDLNARSLTAHKCLGCLQTFRNVAWLLQYQGNNDALLSCLLFVRSPPPGLEFLRG